MANTNVSLTIDSRANTSGLRATAKELKEQKQLLAQLSAAERARASAARAAAAQQRSAAAAATAAANQTAQNQARAATAAERARAATVQADLAARRHQIAQTRVIEEANRSSTAMQKIGSAAQAAGSIASSSFSRLATILTGIVATAGSAGLALAAIGTAGLASGLKNAMDIESQFVLAKGNVASVMGGDRAAAGDFLKRQNAAITAGAGGLIDPGISREFANIFADDIVRAFGAGQPSAEMAASMANQLSALTTLGGNDKGQFKNVIGDFINGSISEAMLQQRDVVGAAGLLKPLQDELNKTGKSIKDLNPGERIKVLDAALKRALTSDTLQELAGTAKGQISILKNRLFGENGFFSVMRDTLPDVEGNQNVFEQFKRSMGLLFNADGLFSEINRLFLSSGINLDIIRTIQSGWTKFNDGLKRLNEWLRNFENFDQLLAEVGGFTGIGQSLAEKVNEAIAQIDAAKVGEFIGNAFNAIGGFIRELDWGLIAQKLGTGLASFFGTLKWDNATALVVAVAGPKLAGLLIGWLTKATTTALASATASSTTAGAAMAAGGGAGLLAKLGGGGGAGLMAKFGLWGAAIAGTLAIFTAPDWNEIGEEIKVDAVKTKANLQKVLKAPADTIKGTAENIGGSINRMQTATQRWQSDVGNGFNNWANNSITGFNNWRSQTSSAISNWTSQTISGFSSWGSTAQITIQTWISNTQNTISTFASSAMSAIQTGWSTVVTTVSTWIANIQTAISTFTSSALAAIQTGWSTVVTTVSTWCTNIQTAISTFVQQMISTTQEIWSQVVSTVSNGWNSIVQAIQGKINEAVSAVQSAASGISEAVSGLFGSISSAISNAASSVRNLLPGGGGGGGEAQSYSASLRSTGGGTLSIGELNIYQQPGEDAERLADRVIAAIDNRIRQRAILQGG